MYENDIALIDAFIAGELTGLDKHKFEMRVKEDLEFAKAVRHQIHAVENLELFGAVQMGTALRADMVDWKKEGFKPYKSEMLAKSTLVKIISTIAVLSVIAGAVWYYTKREESPKEQKPLELSPQKPASIETPESRQNQVDSSIETESYTELKTSEEQVADIQLDIQDPTTFSIIELSEVNGVYTYQISHDGQVQIIKSQDPNMDDRLTKMANEAIEENVQSSNGSSAKNTKTITKKVISKQPQSNQTKPSSELKKDPEIQPLPPAIKPRGDVEDDFPY